MKIVQQNNAHFYCETCAKQFYDVDAHNEHMSSYGHHHKKRLADLRAMEREVEANPIYADARARARSVCV